MGLIDEVELVKALHKAGTVAGQPHFLCRTVYECINKAPKIDAVPVVRCRDCKRSDWYTGANGKHLCYCIEHGSSGHNENDYCSYGEMKDDE